MNASVNSSTHVSSTVPGRTPKGYGRRDSIIAALITFLVVGLLLAWLLVATLRYDERMAASSQNPKLEEDEIFLDPELLL